MSKLSIRFKHIPDAYSDRNQSSLAFRAQSQKMPGSRQPVAAKPQSTKSGER